MNEDGEENLYRYDQKEMTIQRYFQDPAAEEIRGRYVQVAEDYNSLLEDYNVRGYLIAGLFGVSILLVIILVIVLLTRKPGGPKDGGSRGPEREADRFQERPEPLSGSRVRKSAQEESRRLESRTAEPRVSESPTRAEQPEQPDRPFDWKKRRILVAEDNELNREIVTELLQALGAQVITAVNGEEAVRVFRTCAPFAVDAILMDMQMPEMDGCESARRIRAMHRPDADVPIIAVTANAFAEDVAATTAAGINAHVSKPIDFSLLCQTLGKWIRKNR